MRNPFIELSHLSNNLQMARDCCNANTKCLRHFSNTLTWILLNNRMSDPLWTLPHARLILEEASEELCPSLNSCNISRRRLCFVMFIMEGFYPSKLCSV
ncbi:hypothetical protein FHG87_025636 [Trinorchestia longiramus]|nr:hypothetical protein FHG87_025636 [Trinorchestia longiramus]